MDLIARSTYPKLNDTIRREFLQWCPHALDQAYAEPRREHADAEEWFAPSTSDTLHSKANRQRTRKSNLLSATYDWIVVDQLEDPEFSHKDFMDLMGRLRGNTEYVGDDPSMPRVGPSWFMATLNPTRNWCYREIVKPLHDFT